MSSPKNKSPLGILLLISLLIIAALGFTLLFLQGSLDLPALLRGDQSLVTTALEASLRDWKDALVPSAENDSEASAATEISEPSPTAEAEQTSESEQAAESKQTSESEQAAEPEQTAESKQPAESEPAAPEKAADSNPTPDSEQTPTPEQTPDPEQAPDPKQPAADPGSDSSASTGAPTSPAGITIDPLQTVPRDPAPPLSEYYDDPGVMALTTPADYVTVDDSYFADALFLGDSRVDGLAMYGAFPEADCMTLQGGHLYYLFDDGMIYRSQNTLLTMNKHLADLLESKQYGKIYIQIGINDMSAYNSQDYYDSMKETIDKIRETQPDALIFLMSIMNVTRGFAEGGPSPRWINNDAINSRNYQLARLADGETIFYIDENVVFNDENGDLAEDKTPDGVHINSSLYPDWRTFIMEHGIVK